MKRVSKLIVPSRLRTAATMLALAVAACSTDDILTVTDPDIIDPSAVRDAAGANAVYIGALARFNTTTSGSESMYLYSGLLSDEFRSSDTFSQRDETDQRRVQTSNANVNTAYRDVHRARVSAVQAARLLREFSSDSTVQIAHMYLVQAFTEAMLAEHFCSGIPFSEISDAGEDFGAPQTTVQALERALAHADSGLALVTSAASDDKVRFGLAVTRGRILLDLGRFADAGTAVAAVPTTYAYLHQHSQTTRDNGIWSFNNNARRYTVADREGGNGINFISAQDPRLPVTGPVTRGGFDGATDLYRQQVYPTRDASFPIITGIEAKLIIAEAQLQANNAAGFLVTLNALRATKTGLTPLADPGTAAARADLLFRERAFWLYASGHRLGDLRRLVRQYSRGAETVFPTGQHHKGITYGPDVNLPVTQAEENNPSFTGCIDRNA